VIAETPSLSGDLAQGMMCPPLLFFVDIDSAESTTRLSSLNARTRSFRIVQSAAVPHFAAPLAQPFFEQVLQRDFVEHRLREQLIERRLPSSRPLSRRIPDTPKRPYMAFHVDNL